MSDRAWAAMGGVVLLGIVGGWLWIGGDEPAEVEPAAARAPSEEVVAPPSDPPRVAEGEAEPDAPSAPVADEVAPGDVGGEDTWDWEGLDEELTRLEELGWGTFSEDDWARTADDLLADLEALEALPAEEQARHRPEILRLLAQGGRAAQNANDPVWPHYGEVGGAKVNVAWYRAADLVVAAGPELLDALEGSERDAIAQYVGWIEAGTLVADGEPQASE